MEIIIKRIIKKTYFILEKAYHTLNFLFNLFRDILGSFWNSFKHYYKNFKGIEKIITIGYDGYPFLEQLTGVGWYSYHLLKKISENPKIKINLYGKIFLPEEEAPGFFVSLKEFKNLRFRCHGIKDKIFPNRNFWLKISENIFTPLFIKIDKNDLFFCPNFFPPPNFKITEKTICTIHDCTFKVYPQFLQKETLENLNKFLFESIFKSEKIISVSKNTKNDLIKFFNISEKKVKTIYNGLDELEYKEIEIKEKPYILFVSTIEPRKNVLNIIKAFEILKEKNYPFNLILIGKVGWRCEEVLKKLKESKFNGFINHLSYIERNELGSYYKNAFCLLFPSFYEGFGFPILEAFSSGCPVITSKNSSIEEIGGDGCIYVANDPVSISNGVIKLWENEKLRKELVEKGYEIVKNFKWEKTAEETIELFYNILK